MASFTKVIQTPLLALQSIASGAVAKSSVLSVFGTLAATAYVRFGRRSASALTTAVTLRVDGSASDSGDRDWLPLGQLLTNIAAVGSEVPNGTASAGQAVILMASTTGFVVGDNVFIDNTTIGNSEWGRIIAVDVNTSITLEDNLVNAQTAAAAVVYAGAQIFTPMQLDLSGVRRIRAVANGAGSGQAVAVEIKLTTCDSIG